MDQTLKNRLVGVGVLLVLAAIVLPLVFDGANQDALRADTRLPPPPAVPEAEALLTAPAPELPMAEAELARDHVPAEPEAPAPLPPVAVAPGTAPAAAPAAPPATPVAAAPTPAAAPVADPRLAGLAEAWDLQLAAVSAPDGAERLRNKLVAAGYKARVAKVGAFYKVLVGPELRREDAEKLRAKLAADARVGKPADARLVRYIP